MGPPQKQTPVEEPAESELWLAPPDGVPLTVWLRIARRDGELWAIDERDETGATIGTAYRHADGSKSFKKGGKRGMIVDWPLTAYAGTSRDNPLFVCEGASDTAALLGLGLDAIGVPMAGACGEMLAELLRDRHAVIVGDADRAGRMGSDKIAHHALGTAATVKIIEPPCDKKDAREAVLAGAGRSEFLSLATAAEPLDSIQPLGVATDRNEYGLVSIADLGPAEEPDWLWRGFIARGSITLLTGLWKAGKTTLLGYLLRDLYLGSGLVDLKCDAPIIFVSEEPRSLWAARRDELSLPENIYFIQRPSHARPDRGGWRRLIESIRQHVLTLKAGMVVFDTLPSAWPVVEENNAGETIDALTHLRNLTEAGAGVLLIAHPRKSDGEEATATRGSGALTGFVDIIVELRRHSKVDAKDSRRVLKAYGRFDSIPPETVLELGTDGYKVLEGGAVAAEDYMVTIASILPTAPSGMTREELLARWPACKKKAGRTQVLSLLAQGVDLGRWSQSGGGKKGDPFKYFVSPPDSFRSPQSPCERNESEADMARAVANPWSTEHNRA